MLKRRPDSVIASAKQPYGAVLVGKSVETSYGRGYVVDCREEDGYVYSIQLVQKLDQSPLAILYTREVPIRVKTPEEEAQELNVAYEAQEKMRQMNLEMECFEHGIAQVLHDRCTKCLLQGKFSKSGDEEGNRFPRLQKFVDSARETAESAKATAKATASDKNSFPRLRKLVDTATESAAKATPKTNGTSFPRLRGLWGSAAAPASSATSTTTETIKEETSEPDDRKPASSNQQDKETNTKKNTSTEDQKQVASSKRKVLPRIQRLLDEREKMTSNPCLICGNPVCAEHGSSSFKKEGITLCLSCERLFELDFIIECVSTPDPVERGKRIDHMVECYDRCLLILKYSAQYVEQIAQSLEEQKEQQNKIGLGSSGVGVLSGVLGIAAAATILTPAGPPLLIASLFFGGGATAVQTGTEAYNYFSEPNKLADRIIALHGMVLSILRVTSTLRDAMMRNHIRTDVFEAEQASLAETVQEQLEKNKAGVLAVGNMGRAATLGSVAGVEAGAVASAGGVVAAETAAGAGARSATALSRAGTAAARTVRFARFAGGALSAAVLVMEANAIHSTLQDIHNGSPCGKASHIRRISEELRNKDLPTTSELDEECQAYLKVLATLPMPPPEVSAIEANEDVDNIPEAECTRVPASTSQNEGTLIVNGEEGGAPRAAFATPMATAATPQNGSSYFSATGSSLFQSINFGHARNPRRETSARSDDVFAEVANEDARRSQQNDWNLLL